MIGNRLKRARLASKLSLRQLAARINNSVSAQAIGKYENDEMMPASGNLLKLATALDVSAEYLLRQDLIELTGVDFRKSTDGGRKLDAAIESQVIDQLQRHLEIEGIVNLRTKKWQAPSGSVFSPKTLADGEAAATLLRKLWKLGQGPINNIAGLLEQHAIKVILLNLPSDFSGTKAFIKNKNKALIPVIVANANQNSERQRFTYAHELAHLVFSFSPRTPKASREKICDRFAGAFLVDAEYLTSALGGPRSALSFGELLNLKSECQVSLAAMVVRCRQAGLISLALYSQLWAEIKNQGLNNKDTAEPLPSSPDLPMQLERLCYFAVSEQLISESKAAEALQISARELEKRMNIYLTKPTIKAGMNKLVELA
jgi:Zn-dependent peptidase ImmA (M78 family)/transcriptional regulator with XRE-family HTH domain